MTPFNSYVFLAATLEKLTPGLTPRIGGLVQDDFPFSFHGDRFLGYRVTAPLI